MKARFVMFLPYRRESFGEVTARNSVQRTGQARFVQKQGARPLELEF